MSDILTCFQYMWLELSLSRINVHSDGPKGILAIEVRLNCDLIKYTRLGSVVPEYYTFIRY